MVFPSLFEEERSGRQFMAATEINGTPDSGSGVLAHLALKATGEGKSTLRIASSPLVIGPRIIGAGGAPIGDSTGDGVWDSATVGGEVVVGASCSPATPIPTPPPPAGGDNGSNGGGGNGGPPVTALRSITAAVETIISGGSDSSDDGGSASSGSTVEVIDGDSSSGDGDGDNSSTGDDTADNGSTDGSSAGGEDASAARDGSGSANTAPLILGVIALSAVVLGSAVLVLFRARRTGL
jgi:hypothetical protein